MAGPRGATALALFARLAFHASALPTTISSIHSLSALTAEHAPPAPPSDSAAAAPPPSSAPLGVVARVTLSDLAAGGEAVGRLADGRVVFVPGGATGEVVEVAIDAVRKGYARGSLRRIVTASPDRVTPPCSLAAPGRCGGCPLMHLRPSAHASAPLPLARPIGGHSGPAVVCTGAIQPAASDCRLSGATPAARGGAAGPDRPLVSAAGRGRYDRGTVGTPSRRAQCAAGGGADARRAPGAGA